MIVRLNENATAAMKAAKATAEHRSGRRWTYSEIVEALFKIATQSMTPEQKEKARQVVDDYNAAHADSPLPTIAVE